MSFKAIVRELTKEIRDGIGSISRRRGGGGEDGKSSARYYRRGKSHIAPDCSSSTSSSLTAFVTIQEQQQQLSRWANLPPELLLDIIHRVEASETAWPARKDVVACASVCRSWRDITKEIVKTPEQCGSLTFPISLKQPGPRDAPIQCFIKRERATSTYHLYLGLSPALSSDTSKLLLAAKKDQKGNEYRICNIVSSR